MPRHASKTYNYIPKIIHQIWIGNKIPKINSLYMDTCKLKDWEYRLWGNDDITKDNFPITFEYIQKVYQIGKEENCMNKKFAQITDLMRLELLYHHGGIYLDSNIECFKSFDKIFNKKYEFVVSNEDPCGFDCISGNGDYYISNSFIGSTKKNPIIKKILSKKNLSKIDFYSKHVNRETGPYFLGRNLHKLKDTYNITMLATNLIYPHGYKNNYRKRNSYDRCYKHIRNKNTNMELTDSKGNKIYLEYPCKSYRRSYAVKHFESGRSWL
jgi:mannosyltransferase OCH1-like enzyme